MSIYYVLTEGDSVLGVFDSPDISRITLASYYGQDFEEKIHRQVEDSGVEWEKVMLLRDGLCTLTLCSYELNEI